LDEIDAAAESGEGFIPILVEPHPTEATPASPELDQTQEAMPLTEEITVPGLKPDRLVIPSIDLDAPVEPVSQFEVVIGGTTTYMWRAPSGSNVGWHETSALLGKPGNTVMNGHHNTRGEVFRYLEDVKEGDQIIVFSGEVQFIYRVSLTMILHERWEPLEVRLQNASWLGHTEEERLTLVTCWPYASNTHRLIVLADPLSVEGADLGTQAD
jgi:sortase A